MRYTITQEGIKYDFSQGQFDLLAQKSVRLRKPLRWNFEQQVDSLVSKKLFTKKERSISRTKLGDLIFNKILHQKSRSTNGSK